jgi:hypothetical protein
MNGTSSVELCYICGKQKESRDFLLQYKKDYYFIISKTGNLLFDKRNYLHYGSKKRKSLNYFLPSIVFSIFAIVAAI